MLRFVPVFCVLLSGCLALKLDHSTLVSRFSEFKRTFNKEYSCEDEETRRFNVFSENLIAAEKHNAR